MNRCVRGGGLLFAALVHTLSTTTAHLCNPFTTLDPIDPASVLDFGRSVGKATRLHPEFIVSADVTGWEDLAGQRDCSNVHHWDCPKSLREHASLNIAVKPRVGESTELQVANDGLSVEEM